MAPPTAGEDSETQSCHSCRRPPAPTATLTQDFSAPCLLLVLLSLFLPPPPAPRGPAKLRVPCRPLQATDRELGGAHLTLSSWEDGVGP